VYCSLPGLFEHIRIAVVLAFYFEIGVDGAEPVAVLFPELYKSKILHKNTKK
jgi:hypothetical protein